MENQRILELLAKQEITEVIHRYCKAMDTNDATLARDLWHSDGTVTFVGSYEGPAVDFLELAWKVHEQRMTQLHQVTNILIDVDLDEDRASSECYLIAAARMKPGEDKQEYAFRGRYFDTWSRRNGRWAMDHKLYTQEMSEMRTVSPC
jgi:hypothetical protein